MDNSRAQPGSQAAKAERLRELHHGSDVLVLPNAWDAASARIFEAAGFPAVATTSAGVANSLGYSDGEFVPREEMLFVLRRIVSSVKVPVTADIEAGFGPDMDEVLHTVRSVIEAGAVGINFEDSTKDGESILRPISDQIDRISAIRKLGARMGVPLVINARTDTYLVSTNDSAFRFETTVERANAYLAAGADCVFPLMANDSDVIAMLADEIKGPINILALPGTPSATELWKLGVRRVSMGSGPCRATMQLTRRIAEDLHANGTYGMFVNSTMPASEANGLFAGKLQ